MKSRYQSMGVSMAVRREKSGGGGMVVVLLLGSFNASKGGGSARARFLNIHAPDSGFADFLRARTQGRDASFDSVDVDGPQEPGEGAVLGPGEGTTYEVGAATSVFKATRETTAGAFSLAESTLRPETSGPPLHSHRELLDSFYVLEGTLTVRVDDREVEAPPGSYACVPPGIVHTR